MSRADDPAARCARRREESLIHSAISASFTDGSGSAFFSCPSPPAARPHDPPPDPYRFGAATERDGSTHVAAVVKRGKLLSVGTNRSGNRSCGSGFSSFSLHAERAAVKALGDLSLLRGADLYVVRLPHAGHLREGLANDLLYSRPCHECTVFLEKCMRVWGLRRVLYTTDMTVALSPPHYLQELDAAARPPLGEVARNRWERQRRTRRRQDAIRGSLARIEGEAAAGRLKKK